MTVANDVTAIEARLRRVEDILAISSLVATYGPSVDSDSRSVASHLWTSNGMYDVDVGSWNGHDEIAGMLGESGHQTLLAQGCAHVVSAPKIELNGDIATVTCYQQLVRNEGDRFEIYRMTANRWELERNEGEWRITKRTNRLLDGRGDARELLHPTHRDRKEN